MTPPPPFIGLNTYILDIKHWHSTWVADTASGVDEWVTTRDYLGVFKIFNIQQNILHKHFFNCVR
jgi:hypothetical protein